MADNACTMVKPIHSAAQNYRNPNGRVDLARYVKDTFGSAPPDVKSQALGTVRISAPKATQIVLDFKDSTAKPGDSLVIGLLKTHLFGEAWTVNERTPQLEKVIGADGTVKLTTADYQRLSSINTLEIFGLTEDGGARFTPEFRSVPEPKSDAINSGFDAGSGAFSRQDRD